MNKKLKNIFLLSLSIIIVINVPTSVLGNSNEVMDIIQAERTINKFFSSIGNDWDKIPYLHVNEEVDDYINFYGDEENRNKKVGIFNVESAKVFQIIKINYDDVQEMLYEDYGNVETMVFAVGAHYKVFEENAFFCNGEVYYLMSLIKQGNEWKIREYTLISNPEKLKKLGYKFKNSYIRTEELVEKRIDGGVLVNGDGVTYGNLYENMYKNEELSMGAEKALTKYTVPKDDTKLNLVKYNDNNRCTGVVVVEFEDYCHAVLAGEVRDARLDGQARRASCIAIKTYTWHFIILPKEPERSGNITTRQQEYAPEKKDENPNIYIDYSAVRNRWMESSEGYIFEAAYKSGDWDRPGNQNSGDLKQRGCYYLANKGYKWYQMLHYYYDNSNVSGGAIRLFDSNKCIVYK